VYKSKELRTVKTEHNDAESEKLRADKAEQPLSTSTSTRSYVRTGPNKPLLGSMIAQSPRNCTESKKLRADNAEQAYKPKLPSSSDPRVALPTACRFSCSVSTRADSFATRFLYERAKIEKLRVDKAERAYSKEHERAFKS
jgi:hypothetical protein